MLLYLGVETFLELVDASRELKRTTDKATTPEELEQAGQRFAKRVGPELARVFVLAVTVAVSYGMSGGSAWLASRLTMLPASSEAAAMGASRVGLRLAGVGQVSAVAVSIDGTITLTLAPNKVRVQGHQGPHPEEYHREVFRRLDRATSTCRTPEQCRTSLVKELKSLAEEISTPGTRLNRLITRS